MAVQELEVTQVDPTDQTAAVAEHNRQVEEDRRRKERWALLLLLLFKNLEDDLHQVAREYGKGDLTPREFGDEVYRFLPMAHAQAAYLGRRHAGITGAFDEDDMRFGLHAAEEQEQFLQGFVEDLSGGRYERPGADKTTTVIDVPMLERRLTKYAMAVAATANEAWVEGMPEATLYHWRDVRDKAECPDCEKWALQGPYDRDSLPAIPGDGTSECKSNCRCELITTDGERSFDLRALFDGERLIDG
jgi:hypothetical protein